MAAATIDWTKPQQLAPLDIAFPATVCGTLIPPMEEIPEEFRRSRSPWNDIVSALFFEGGKLPACKQGIDAKAAKGHLQAVLGSFEPAHEHKEAGAAYLMSLWYELPAKEKKKK